LDNETDDGDDDEEPLEGTGTELDETTLFVDSSSFASPVDGVVILKLIASDVVVDGTNEEVVGCRVEPEVALEMDVAETSLLEVMILSKRRIQCIMRVCSSTISVSGIEREGDARSGDAGGESPNIEFPAGGGIASNESMLFP